MRHLLPLALLSLLSLSACSAELFGRDSCFVRGTLVRTPAGNVPIESLRVGDEVLSFTTDHHAIVVRRVTHLLTARVPAVRLIGVGGTTITTTSEHPFWDAERRTWTPARDLVTGTVLMQLDASGHTRPAVVEWVRDELRPETEVFNITVEGPEHDYFANDIGVHNKSPVSEPNPYPNAPLEVSVEVRSLSSDVVIDRGVIARSILLELPLAVTAVGDAPHTTKVSGSTPLEPDGWVTVLDHGLKSIEPAAFFTVLGEKRETTYLAVGRGAVVVVPAPGGGHTLQAIEPARMSIVAVGSGAAVCASAVADSRLRWSGAPPSSTAATQITSQTWNADTSCVTAELSSPAATGATFRACLPSDAWPFVVGDHIVFEDRSDPAKGEEILHLQGEQGVTAGVTLERLTIDDPSAGRRSYGAPLLIVLEERPTCATVDATCGDLRVAASAIVEIDGLPTPIPTGTSFDLPGTEGRATKWVVSASGTVIANPLCAAGDLPRARQTLEVVTLVRY